MSRQSDSRRGRTPSQRIEQHGVCKSCGRALIIVRTTGKGFTSHHEAPLCEAYKKLLDEHPPIKSGVSVEVEIPHTEPKCSICYLPFSRCTCTENGYR